MHQFPPPEGIVLYPHAKGYRLRIGRNSNGHPKDWYWATKLGPKHAQQQAWEVKIVWEARKFLAGQLGIESVSWDTPLDQEDIERIIEQRFGVEKPDLGWPRHGNLSGHRLTSPTPPSVVVLPIGEFLDRIIWGDCLEIMPTIPDASIDMILCDLPYGETQHSWDQRISCERLWRQYMRIAKKSAAIVLTATQPFASELIASSLGMFKYELVWLKNKPTGYLNAASQPLPIHENVLVFYDKQPVYNPQKTMGHEPVHRFTKGGNDGSSYGATEEGFSGGGQTDRYPTSALPFASVANNSDDRLHPTQKPVALFEYLIKTYTNVGQLVLDNCIGSGTTAIAASRQGRKFIGIEKNKGYYDMAVQRIRESELPEEPEIISGIECAPVVRL